MGCGLRRWRARTLGGYLGDLVAALLLLLSHDSRRLFGIRGIRRRRQHPAGSAASDLGLFRRLRHVLPQVCAHVHGIELPGAADLV
jgi:hypothetical protein